MSHEYTEAFNKGYDLGYSDGVKDRNNQYGKNTQISAEDLNKALQEAYEGGYNAAMDWRDNCDILDQEFKDAEELERNGG